jgi:hypothetical protein
MTPHGARPTLVTGLAIVVACGSDHTTGLRALRCTGSGGQPLGLAVGADTSIDPGSDSGCVPFAANPSGDTVEYVLIAQSAAPVPGRMSPFRLQGTQSAGAAAQPVAPLPGATSSLAARFDAFRSRLARTGSYGTLTASPPPLAAVQAASTGPPAVGSRRSFRVCATLDCSSLKPVTGRADLVGAHVAFYVDTLAPAGELDSAALDSLGALFDSWLYPIDTAAFGGVSDVDGNGVVVVLMTGVVNALVTNAQCRRDGYVAGFFFGGDLNPSFTSQFSDGEIYYSIVPDPDSTLSCPHSVAAVEGIAPMTFVHELQHMISYGQHVLVRHGPAEEGWLDEGLSKYAEELAGRSFLPGDQTAFTHYVIDDLYDAYRYLAATGDTPLLVPMDTGGLPEVGACWLFVRYLVDQYGDSLPLRLHQTTLTGAANVEAGTGQPFAVVVGHWALANWVSDLPGVVAPAELRYSSWNFRATFAALNALDPPDFPLRFPLAPVITTAEALDVTGTMRSGSGVYVRVLQPPGSASFSVSFTADGATPLPSAVVPRLVIARVR